VRWDAPVTDEPATQVETPVGDRCALCDEAIVEGDQGTFLANVVPECKYGHPPVHRECSLRAVLGGIGHHEDHVYWCGERCDPDGGRTYRESALAVWARMTAA
jgi:hypothetical protein